MSRSMKFGIAAVTGAIVISLMATDDAEARRRFRRGFRTASYSSNNWNSGYSTVNSGYSNGCGCAPVATCNTGCATNTCGISTGGCQTGGCEIAGGSIGYSGGHSAGYGNSVQGQNLSSPPPAPHGAPHQAPQLNGATSPSDRSDSAPPPPDQNRSSDRETDRSPPPPPTEGQ